MSFSKLVYIFFIFKIVSLGAIKASSSAIGNSTELKLENTLIEFMADLKKFAFDELQGETRLVVLGRKESFLQSTKVLLESSRPYFVSTEAEAIVFPLHFGADSVVLFFIDGFSDSEMNSTFAKLPSDFKCKALLISVEENRTAESMEAIVSAASKMHLKNVFVVYYDGEEIKFYKKLLTPRCRSEITLLNTWRPSEGFSKNITSIERQTATIDSYGCPMIVSTLFLSPTMRLEKYENNTWYITGGLEGRLIRTIAKRLNASLHLRVPVAVRKLWVMPDGRFSGIVGHVARGVANFGIGQIRPTPARAKLVDFTTSYNYECMKWTVPVRAQYNFSVVISEFSTTTWIMVILSVALCCGLVYAIPRLNIGYSPSITIFDVIAMTLNYAIPRNPSSLLFKLFFLLYLNYSRIISTAYSTSLSSILTTMTPEPDIVDEEGIIAAGLRTAGSESSLEMLKYQISANSARAELINRYEVISSAEVAMKRLTDRQDIAYLRHHSTIVHLANKLAMAGKPVKFYPIPGCVISFNSVMVTPKGSPLTGAVNDIILRLREAGINHHWLRIDRAFESDEFKTLDPEESSLFRLESIFLLYFCCLLPAVVTFGAELVAFKLKLNWFTR